MQPETLNQVQVGTVRRQAAWTETRFQQRKGGLGRRTRMIRGVVQDQEDGLVWGQVAGEIVEKLDKAITVFLNDGQGHDCIRDKVVGTAQVMPLLLTRCGNAFLHPPLHPTGP